VINAFQRVETGTPSAFIASSSSSPDSDEISGAAVRVASLLDATLRGGDLESLRFALSSDPMQTPFSRDIFAAAVHHLADTADVRSVADLRSLIHSCAKVERKLFADDPVIFNIDAAFAFAM
jgi:hypothetical protein